VVEASDSRLLVDDLMTVRVPMMPNQSQKREAFLLNSVLPRVDYSLVYFDCW
jgi:hypothetical protein